MIGSTISHYRVLERLGQGGMGEVFLCEDLRLHRPVALKLLRQQSGCVDEERARVMREARLASSLNHPNIAVIYDVEESETPAGRVFLLAMEYVPGRTFAQVAAESSLSLDEILDLIDQAADGLAEAHARGIVHRDVKPSNLMVAQGRVKVLDFGIARLEARLSADAPTLTRDLSLSATTDGRLEGSPYYMSPEQAKGQGLDPRSDIFSLGVVFYELLAGRRPFAGDNLVQVIDSILHSAPPPLPIRFTDPRVPEVERLVSRMLAKDPAERPADLRAMRADLNRMRSGAPALPSPSAALTVAVAGFANVTRRAEDEWLGTGLLETVTAALQGVEGLEVWGRERVRESLRRLGVEASELGSEDAVSLGRVTGARWVLAGAFQRQEDAVRVTVRVVDVEAGRVLRAVKLDGSLSDIFDLQDRVVNELVVGLRRTVAVAGEDEETEIVPAYEAFSKGLLNIRADTYESLDRAIRFFERALALDPNYVRAQLELGAAYGQKGEILAAPELLERATTILRRVIDLRPRLPRAWRELGMVLVAQSRFDEGIESLRRALTLAPEDPRILASMGRGYFIAQGDFARAAELFARAVEHNPGAGWYLLQLAHCSALLRDFARGEPAARRAIQLQEASLSGQQGVQLVGAYMRLGHLLALQGRFDDAADAFSSELAYVGRIDHALRSRIRIELHMRLGAALLGRGDRERAEHAFATGLEEFADRLALGADEPFTRYYAAGLHALRGEADEALALLESSVAAIPAFTLARARIEPEWENLRGEPRFERLLASPR